VGPGGPAAGGCLRVIRVDLLGHGRSASPVSGYDIPTQARRVGAALDRLGAGRVTVIGHSTGGSVATALAEQRPGAVAALTLIDTGPSPDAYISQGLLPRLLLAPLPGRLLWRLRTEATIRKAMRTAFTRPIDIPDAIIEDTLRMTHRAVAGTARASLDYLRQQTLPDRLAPLGLPVLVVFGTDDRRWRSSSAPAYRVVPGARVELLPGVGHTPDAGRPANDREIADRLCRSRRAPQLTAPRYRHPRPNRAFVQLCAQLRPSGTCSTAAPPQQQCPAPSRPRRSDTTHRSRQWRAQIRDFRAQPPVRDLAP